MRFGGTKPGNCFDSCRVVRVVRVVRAKMCAGVRMRLSIARVFFESLASVVVRPVPRPAPPSCC
eukprot:12420448-Karenia_brevis.AAC.1